MTDKNQTTLKHGDKVTVTGKGKKVWDAVEINGVLMLKDENGKFYTQDRLRIMKLEIEVFDEKDRLC